MRNVAILLFVFVLPNVLTAKERHKHRHHGSHQHGVGKIDIAMEGEKLAIKMQFSLHDVLGFEHEPKNEKQKKMLKELEIEFKKSTFNLAVGRCDLSKFDFDLKRKSHSKKSSKDVKSVHNEEKNHVEKEEKSESATHVDLYVNYGFSCKSLSALKTIRFNILKRFKELEKVNGQLINSRGGRKFELRPPNFTLKI